MNKMIHRITCAKNSTIISKFILIKRGYIGLDSKYKDNNI